MIQDQILKSLSELPGGFHLAEASPGGMILNKGETFEKVTPAKLKEYCLKNASVAFIAGVKTSITGNGRVSAKDVENKPLMFFDMDLKDLPDGDGWAEKTPTERQQKVENLLNDALQKVTATFGTCYIASFSGNGLHLFFRMEKPFPIKNDYKNFYLYLCGILESCFKEGTKFDRACADAARLARLPGSTNHKNKNKPVMTATLQFNCDADSSEKMAGHYQRFEKKMTQVQAEKAVKEAESRSTLLRGRDNHTDHVRDALTFQAILGHFGKAYDPKDAPKGEKLIFSPLRDDGSTPSFYLDESRGLWKDFGGGGSGGDKFDLIASLAGITSRQDFPKVIKIAEQITGIEKPKKLSRARGGGGDEATYEDYATFFKQRIPGVRKCVVSNEGYIKNENNMWVNVVNKIGVLKSHATDTEKLTWTPVPFHLDRFVEELPTQLLVDIPKWDGIDRIKMCAEALQVGNLGPSEVEYFLKDWLRKIFLKLKDNSIQNRMILLKGAQGIGKDHWINAIVGGLERYQVDLTLNRDETDNLAELADRLVIKVAEFDRTARADIATLKDWITKPEVTFRKKYAKASETRPARASFIGSVNVDDFLRDHTGNRRFVVLDVKGIVWTYPTDESRQILAQAHHMAENEFAGNSAAEKKMANFVEGMTPGNPDEEVVELFQEWLTDLIENKKYPAIKKMADNRTVVPVGDGEVRKIIAELGKHFRWTPQTVANKLKLRGLQVRGTGGQRYWLYAQQP
jgi:hypothetical protein